MSDQLTITAPSTEKRVTAQSQGTIRFVVHNHASSDRAFQVSIAEPQDRPDWLVLESEEVMTIPAGKTKDVVLAVRPPKMDEERAYSVRIDAVATDAPDDVRAASPTVQLFVPVLAQSRLGLLIGAGVGAVVLLGAIIGLIAALTTKSGLGEACEKTGECESGLTCAKNAAGQDVCLAIIGSACAGDADCETLRCDDGQCAERVLAAGELCRPDIPCAEGLSCSKKTPQRDPTCVLPAGAECSTDAECSTTFCSTESFKCETAPLHVKCDQTSDCFLDQQCTKLTPSGDKKACLLVNGASCSEDLQCASDWCKGRKCVAYTGRCSSNADCRSATEKCTHGICALKEGQPCERSLQCYEGPCRNGFCVAPPGPYARCGTTSRWDWDTRRCVRTKVLMTRATRAALQRAHSEAVRRAAAASRIYRGRKSLK